MQVKLVKAVQTDETVDTVETPKTLETEEVFIVIKHTAVAQFEIYFLQLSTYIF